MKRLLCLALPIVLAVLTACSAPAPQEKDVPIDDIAAVVATEDQFAMSFEIDEGYISEMTGLDFAMLEDYYIQEPPMISSTVLYIVKVKDQGDVETVKLALEKRLELIQASFQYYLPDQYELALAGQVVVQGRYLMLAVANDTAKAVEAFEEVLAV